MTETERAAWAALELGILDDAVAAGLITHRHDTDGVLRLLMINALAHAYERVVTDNGDGTWSHTLTAKGGKT